MSIGLVFALSAATPGQAQQSFPDFLKGVETEARAQGVSPATLDLALKGLRPDMSLLEPPRPPGDPAQPGDHRTEPVRSPHSYLEAGQFARLTTTGRALARTYATTLQQIETQFGVDGGILLAIWGRETAFGTQRLTFDAINLLATQAWRGQQRGASRAELIAALRLLQGGLPRGALRSSSSGAIGLTQMMPSEVLAHGVDMDRDGRIDPASSVPDALASMASRLRSRGWTPGLRWGFEVILPSRELCMQEGAGGIKPLAAWSKLGVKRAAAITGEEPSDNAKAYLLQPAGAFGPAFLVTENFAALLRSTAGEVPALFIASLADRIAGGGDFFSPLQNPPPLSPREIEAVQRNLQTWGFAVDRVDGRIGSATRAQVGAYQRSMSIIVTCWPTPHLLEHMRQAQRAREEASSSSQQDGSHGQAQGEAPALSTGAGTRGGSGGATSSGRNPHPGAKPGVPAGPSIGGPGR